MRRIRLLKRNKGFTIIELIVVIVIIGILIALAVAAANPGDKHSAGKSYAKDYYYKVQSFMSRKKLADTHVNDADDTNKTIKADTIFYVDLKAASPNITEDNCGIAKAGDVTRTEYSAISDAKMKTLVGAFSREMAKTISAPAFDGTFYAVVDSSYRVQAAYWTDGDWAGISGGLDFTDDCVISSGFCSCAYPIRLCRPEGSSQKVMFTY